MKAKRILSLTAALALLTAPALAEMTAEDFEAIWQSSLTRMNATALPRVFTELPSADDLTYDEALSIARQAIFDQYAAPADELDAMGLYPDYFAPEEGRPAEWRFYFTPLANACIDEDHPYAAPGEYNVYLDSPSGEVTLCLWYIDDFWPYADRLWDAGKTDVLYEYARKSAFLTLPADEQDLWLARLEAAGYDMTDVRTGEALFRDGEFVFALRRESHPALDPETNPRAAAAWQALADTFDLDPGLMRQYGYIAFDSPLDGPGRDVFIVYDGGMEWNMRRGGDVDYWCSRLLGEVDRLGLYLVRFDPGTGEVKHVARCDRPTVPADEGDPALLLGRPQWSAADLPIFDEAYRALEATMTDALNQGLRRDEQQPVADEFMRGLGGSPQRYPGADAPVSIGLEAGLPIAMRAAAEAAGLSEEDFSARFSVATMGYIPEADAFDYWFVAPVEVDEIMYYVRLDTAGHVLQASLSEGNG